MGYYDVTVESWLEPLQSDTHKKKLERPTQSNSYMVIDMSNGSHVLNCLARRVAMLYVCESGDRASLSTVSETYKTANWSKLI
jgi:hypothetical protein